MSLEVYCRIFSWWSYEPFWTMLLCWIRVLVIFSGWVESVRLLIFYLHGCNEVYFSRIQLFRLPAVRRTIGVLQGIRKYNIQPGRQWLLSQLIKMSDSSRRVAYVALSGTLGLRECLPRRISCYAMPRSYGARIA
jgi:hypothetical protein